MSNLTTRNIHALRILMTEDLYILPEEENLIPENAEKIIAKLPEKEAEAPEESIFSYLGENNKYFLILFEEHQHKEMSGQHKETLLKIMSAKGLELRDLAIMNLSQFKSADFKSLKEFFSFNKIVLFGIDPQRISLPNLSLNQVETLENAKILCTFGIEEMINDTLKKREFWNVMKNF